MKDGIINVYKPQEWTSHDVAAVLRRLTGEKRTGHTGTLDPMATGVLPVCIGKATRVMEYLDADLKTYRCEMKLGITTDTLDIWGEVTEEKDISGITEEQVRAVESRFKGTIVQIPPKYSALKVDGKKLYEYARAGADVKIKPREVYIKEFQIDRIDMETGELSFVCVCSKGTYIRSICRDIGEALGCGGTMTALERLASGVFTVDDAVDIETLKNMERSDIEKLLYPCDAPLIYFGRGFVNEEAAERFANGSRLEESEVKVLTTPVFAKRNAPMRINESYSKLYNIYDDKKEFVGTAVIQDDGSFKVDKIFRRV